MTSNKNDTYCDPYIHVPIAFRFCRFDTDFLILPAFAPRYLTIWTHLHLSPRVSFFHFSSHARAFAQRWVIISAYRLSYPLHIPVTSVFFCLFVFFAGETCFLHLDLERSAYFFSLPDCLFQTEYRFSFPLSFAMSSAVIYPWFGLKHHNIEPFSVRLFSFLCCSWWVIRLYWGWLIDYLWKIWNQDWYARVLIPLLIFLYLLVCCFRANLHKRILSLLRYHHISPCVSCFPWSPGSLQWHLGLAAFSLWFSCSLHSSSNSILCLPS